MGKIADTFREARLIDKKIWENENSSPHEVLRAMANANGRKFIIGSISGTCRLVKSIAAVALAAIGATFCLIGSILYSPVYLLGLINSASGNGGAGISGYGAIILFLPSTQFLLGAKKCGEFALENIKDGARGVVEILPFTGYALAKYDIAQHNKKVGSNFNLI